MKITRLVPTFFWMMIGLGILFVSLTRASLEIVAAEGGGNNLRINPIEIVVMDDMGEEVVFEYKLPEVNTLPTNPFYGFKKIRDWMWLGLSRGAVNKARVAILIGDKKIAEAKMLFKESRPKAALEASKEALERLKYADKLIGDIQKEMEEANQIKTKLFEAGQAYKQIITDSSKDSFEMDPIKYETLINEIDVFNEEKQKEREAETY